MFLFRYIAVTQPIKYAKHKSNQRVVLTIAIVWIVSAAIGSPIVLGLNTSPDRDPMLCMFYNPDFIIYSSLSSFYIPCIIMVFLYYRIFKAIHARAKKSAAAKKAHRANLRPDTIIENVAHSKHLQGPGNKKGRNVLCRYKETVTLCVSLEPDHPTTNTESGSQENEEEEAEVEELCPNTDCHVIRNDKSTEFILGPVSDDGRLSAALTTTSTSAPSTPFPMSEQKALLEHNGSHDSGYGLSNMEETTFQVAVNEVTLASPKDLERSKRGGSVSSHHKRKSSKRNGTVVGVQGSGVGTGVPTLGPSGGGADTTDGVNYNESETGCEVRRTPDGHLSPGERRKKPRFHLVRTHKSSRKKREKSAAKKERKATKTLAIVLGETFFVDHQTVGFESWH